MKVYFNFLQYTFSFLFVTTGYFTPNVVGYFTSDAVGNFTSDTFGYLTKTKNPLCSRPARGADKRCPHGSTQSFHFISIDSSIRPHHFWTTRTKAVFIGRVVPHSICEMLFSFCILSGRTWLNETSPIWIV